MTKPASLLAGVRAARRAGPILACSALALTSACAPRMAAETVPWGPGQDRLASAPRLPGQPELSLGHLGALAATRRNDLGLQARYAAGLARAGDIAAAERVLSEAIARAPDHPALLVEMARLRLREGSAPVALALFERAARLGGGADAEAGRGIALDLLGRHAEAQDAHRAALALDPNRTSVQNNLAMSLMLEGRGQEALALLEPLGRRADAPARVANNLAIARSMQAESGQAGSRRLGEIVADLRTNMGVRAPAPGAAPASMLATADSPPARPAMREAAPDVVAAATLALPAATLPSSVAAPLPPVEFRARPTPQPVAFAAAPNPSREIARPTGEPEPFLLFGIIPVPEFIVSLFTPAPSRSAEPPLVPPTAELAPVAPIAPVDLAQPASVPVEATTQRSRPVAPRAEAPLPLAPVASPAEPLVMPAPPRLAAAAPRSEARSLERGSSYAVQVAAAGSENAARLYWDVLAARLPALFGERRPSVERAELAHGVFWRLRTGGFETLAEARDFCRDLRDAGRDCWVSHR